MRAFNKAKRTNNQHDKHQAWSVYNQLRNSYQDKLREAELEYNTKLSASLKNPKCKKKAWWRTVKHFLNQNQSSAIPSLLFEGKQIPDNPSKAQIFNTFFLSQGIIDTSAIQIPPVANTAYNVLSNLIINDKEVLDVLKTLDVTKATGPDGVSIRLLKEAAPFIYKSLTRLFNLSLQSKKFPTDWKRAHVTPLFKSGDMMSCNNYRPISLLSCTGKVMEKVIFKHVFNFFRDNQVISSNQSGFMPGDSTVNQLLSLYHELALAIDQQKEIRIVFLDISKAFDKVWHDGLLYKLERNGIKGNLLSWFKDYLHNRQQRVVLNGHSSSWGAITAGVPQGSVLGPLLFLIFINDLVNIVNSKIKLFADDTCLYISVDDVAEAAATINSDLSSVEGWAKDWAVSFNALKTDAMLISRKHHTVNHPPLVFQGHQLTDVQQHKHLGIVIKSDLKWTAHISQIIIKATKQLNIMKALQYSLDRETLETIYFSFIRPILEYGSAIWDGCAQSDTQLLENIQLTAARTVTGAMRTTPNVKLYEETCWETLADRRENTKLIFMYKIINNLTPDYLRNLIPNIPTADTPINYNTRRRFDLPHFRARTDLFDKSFFPSATRLWNLLPLNIRNAPTLSQFKSKLSSSPHRLVKHSSLVNVGNRYLSILHARLRMGRSQLNEHLHKIGIKDSPMCSCGQGVEDVWHYFFACPSYVIYRNHLHAVISTFAPFNIHTVLYGCGKCNLESNTMIFMAVQEFIKESGRFGTLNQN